MSYYHGVTVTEQKTRQPVAVQSTASVQVVVGTAPINHLADPAAAVNTPMLVRTYAEAVAAVGMSGDYEKYTLCESIEASLRVMNVGPMVLINVLDPATHNKNVTETVAVADGKATVSDKDILPGTLTVANGEDELEAGTDYTAAWGADGKLVIALADGTGVESLTVSGKAIDPTAVTAADIVGGVDQVTGKETGLEVVRQVYPKLNIVPGILLAPRYSAKPAVSAAIQAKAERINGVFSAVAVIDIDSGTGGARRYGDVEQQKKAQGLNSTYAYAVWGYGTVADGTISGSALAAALTARTDADNGDVPNVSPSNKTMNILGACLADGTELLLDEEQASVVNACGVATIVNTDGFRLYGNSTTCYPENQDSKDRFFSIRRFFNWRKNDFIRTYRTQLDNPANKRMIETIVDSENALGNSLASRGICARYEIVFEESENDTAGLADGVINFHMYMTPYPPAEQIGCTVEYDVSALNSALLG